MKIKNNISKRIGRIEIDINDIRNMQEELLNLIFRNFYPLSISNDYDYNRYTSVYTGLSSLFDEVEQGTVIPFYVLNLDLDKEEITFEKVK